MQFPKYIETAAGELFIFNGGWLHLEFANLVKAQVVSAGMVSASARPSGKFFGESTTLRVMGNKNLDWSAHGWFESLLLPENELIFSNSLLALQALDAPEILPATWREVNGVRFPSSGRLPDAQVLDYFLP